MNKSRAACGLLLMLVLMSAAGCKKSEHINPTASPAPTPLSPDTVARVHWMGKRQLGVTGGAFTFKRYWDLDQSKKLEFRTLDKISIAPWRLLQGEASIESAPGFMLRMLLDDVVQEECYFEMRGPANRSLEMVFAIRLNNERAGLWRTNLALVAGSLTGVPSMDLQDRGQSWSIKRQTPPLNVQLVRVGEWTVLGLAQETNSLLREVIVRVQRDRMPFVSSGTNLWLEADLDLNGAVHAIPREWELSENLPRLSFDVTGDGGTVITRGNLLFPHPLALELEPWTIPTNLIHEPLVSFTAMRGFKPWLGKQKFWTERLPDTTPNQIYSWAMDGAAFHTWFAIPLPDASNQVHRLTQQLLGRGNEWLVARDYVSFQPLSQANGVVWGSQSNLLPFVRSLETEQGGVVFSGLLPVISVATNSPPPLGMIQDISRRTNLVYYDWEMTGQRVDSWLYLGQTVREISRHHPMSMDSAGIEWLNLLRPRLGSTATVVTRTETNQLTFVRRSTFGFTGVELHLLADWFESYKFPAGLYSLLGSPAPAQ